MCKGTVAEGAWYKGVSGVFSTCYRFRLTHRVVEIFVSSGNPYFVDGISKIAFAQGSLYYKMFISHLVFFELFIFMKFYALLFSMDDDGFFGVKKYFSGALPADVFGRLLIFFADERHASCRVIVHVLLV